MREDVERLYLQMKGGKPSLLAQELQRIIENKNYLGLASIIAKLIKSMLSVKEMRLQKERDQLFQIVKDQKLGKDEEDAARKKIDI